jgi:hypothetical protein
MKALVAALPLLLVAACRLHYAGTAPIPSTNIPESVSMPVAGTYVHPGSGQPFPEKAAGFSRTDVSRYDLEGNDVGVHYRAFAADFQLLFRAEVTLFVFPSLRLPDGTEISLEEQFAQEVGEIRTNKHYSQVREVRRASADAIRDGGPVRVRAAEFEYVGDERIGRLKMTTILVAFLDGPWHVTYRADFPPMRRTQCLCAVERLVAALGLPPTGLPAAAD